MLSYCLSFYNIDSSIVNTLAWDLRQSWRWSLKNVQTNQNNFCHYKKCLYRTDTIICQLDVGIFTKVFLSRSVPESKVMGIVLLSSDYYYWYCI